MSKGRIKQHFSDNKEIYLVVGTTVVVAGITYLIMRGVAARSIKGANYGVLAEGANYGVLGERIEMNNVSFISSHRQGPPSWVIKCLETGDVFKSQSEAAKALGISASKISEQLNGARNNAMGYHFERICLAL